MSRSGACNNMVQFDPILALAPVLPTPPALSKPGFGKVLDAKVAEREPDVPEPPPPPGDPEEKATEVAPEEPNAQELQPDQSPTPPNVPLPQFVALLVPNATVELSVPTPVAQVQPAEGVAPVVTPPIQAVVTGPVATTEAVTQLANPIPGLTPAETQETMPTAVSITPEAIVPQAVDPATGEPAVQPPMDQPTLQVTGPRITEAGPELLPQSDLETLNPVAVVTAPAAESAPETTKPQPPAPNGVDPELVQKGDRGAAPPTPVAVESGEPVQVTPTQSEEAPIQEGPRPEAAPKAQPEPMKGSALEAPTAETQAPVEQANSNPNASEGDGQSSTFGEQTVMGLVTPTAEEGIESEGEVTLPSPAPTQAALAEGPKVALTQAPSNEPAAQVGLPGDLTDQIAEKADALLSLTRSGQIKIMLEPESLGAITITIKQLGFRSEADISVSNEQVRTHLESDKARLIQAVETKGITLSQVNISGHGAEAQTGQQAAQQDRMDRNDFEQANRLHTQPSPKADQPQAPTLRRLATAGLDMVM